MSATALACSKLLVSLDVVKAGSVYTMRHVPCTCDSPAKWRMVHLCRLLANHQHSRDNRVFKDKTTLPSQGFQAPGQWGRKAGETEATTRTDTWCSPLGSAQTPPPGAFPHSSKLLLSQVSHGTFYSALSATCHINCKDWLSCLFPCILISWE